MKRASTVLLILVVPLIVSLQFTAHTQTAKDTRPVLVILHGILETDRDMDEVSEAANGTGMFSRVAAIHYQWRTSTVSQVAPKVFDYLNAKYPDSKFVLYGYSKGGLVAEWITERVKEADGRVERVITIDSPLDGADPTGLVESEKVLPLSEQIDVHWPGIDELTPGSNIHTIRDLESTPINDISGVEFVRVWGKDDLTVIQSSALCEPPGNVLKTYRVIATSTEKGSIYKNGETLYKPTDHRAMRSFLAKHTGLLKHILSGNLPREATTQPLVMADERVDSRSQLPTGTDWVACTCPAAHAGLGIWVGGTMYHDRRFLCPTERCIEK